MNGQFRNQRSKSNNSVPQDIRTPGACQFQLNQKTLSLVSLIPDYSSAGPSLILSFIISDPFICLLSPSGAFRGTSESGRLSCRLLDSIRATPREHMPSCFRFAGYIGSKSHITSAPTDFLVVRSFLACNFPNLIVDSMPEVPTSAMMTYRRIKLCHQCRSFTWLHPTRF